MTPAVNARHAQFAAATSALMIAQQVAGKAARDALFLTSFHTGNLPVVMASGALLSLVGASLLAHLMSRYSPATLAPLLFLANGVCFGVETVLQLGSPALAAILLYLHTAIFSPAAISTFWSLVNEAFEPHTAKKAVAKIAGGGTVGGVLGGLAAWRASMAVRPEAILLGLLVLNALAAICARASSPKAPAAQASPDKSAGSIESSFQTLRKAPFLRNLALLIALGAATSALLDYVFSAQAVAHFGRGPGLLSFFALFWLGVSVLSFLIQVSLGRVAIKKLSLALNIAVLPGIILFGGALGLAVPGLASSALLRGGEAVQRNTLFRSAYELLYTPVAEERKRTTKSLIDIGFDRLGTVAGSALVFIALRLFSGHGPTVLLGTVVVLALATFPVARQLHFGYVEALEESMNDAEKKLGHDATSSRARLSTGLSQAPASDRERLIERLEDLQPGGLTALLDPTAAAASDTPQAKPPEAIASGSRSVTVVGDLLSGEIARVLAALQQLEPRDPGVACALLLLARRDLHEHVSKALIKIAPNITGQLIDALLDPGSDFDTRRRLPYVLTTCANQRSAEGLLLGLGDERFEVRYECGRALFKLTETERSLMISREKAVAAIRYEVGLAERLLSEETADIQDDGPQDDQTRLLQGLKQDRASRSLAHVFHILCLHLDRGPILTAFRALHHRDVRFRGTALEYLSTVLPDEVRELVWPYFREERPLPVARNAQELLAELARADLTTSSEPEASPLAASDSSSIKAK